MFVSPCEWDLGMMAAGSMEQRLRSMLLPRDEAAGPGAPAEEAPRGASRSAGNAEPRAGLATAERSATGCPTVGDNKFQAMAVDNSYWLNKQAGWKRRPID